MKSGAGGCEALPTPCESFQLQAKSDAIEHIQTVMTITEHNAVPVSIVLNPEDGVALVCKKGENVHDILFAQHDNFVGASHSESPCGWWLGGELSFSVNAHTIHRLLKIASWLTDFLWIFFSSCHFTFNAG